MNEELRKKKILYVITKSNWGGAQRYVYDLAAYFNADENYKVVVALGGAGELKRKLEERNIRVVELAGLKRDIKILGDIRAFWGILNLLRTETPDIVHLNSTKVGFLGALACFFYNLSHVSCRLSLVFTAHGWAFNEKRPLWQRALIALMQWKTVLLCAHTIVVSEHLKKQIRWWPFTAEKISVIHNGVPELSFLPRDEARSKLASLFPFAGNMPGELWLGTVAELHKNKGLDVAIAALALLKKQNPAIAVRYFIASDGEERARLMNQIAKLGLQHTVFLVGHLPDAYKYLQAFDIFLLPSRTEALCYALLEAGGAGLPVVATAVGGIPEIVTHKRSGLLVSPENPRALAHALRFMIEHPAAREAAGRALHSTVKDKFPLETMREKTRRLYEHISMKEISPVL